MHRIQFELLKVTRNGENVSISESFALCRLYLTHLPEVIIHSVQFSLEFSIYLKSKVWTAGRNCTQSSEPNASFRHRTKTLCTSTQ